MSDLFKFIRKAYVPSVGKVPGIRKNKSRITELPAAMTLEAVIILPIALAVCFLILWTGMLLYNRTAAEYAVSVSAIQAARQAEAENGEILKLAEDKLKELLKGKLVQMETISVHVSVDAFSVKTSVEGKMRAPVIPMIGGLHGQNWKIQAQREAPRLKESMIVRTIKRISEGR